MATAVRPGQITLVPGKTARAPADTTSSVRVRMADRTRHPFPVSAREIGLVLEVAPEPRLLWQGVTAVHIDRAIDDNDQKLKQADGGVAAGPAAGVIFLAGGGMVMPGRPGAWAGGGGGGLVSGPGSAGVYHFTTARLGKGGKESKSLKELAGTIEARVLGGVEQMIVADDLMKAAGKAFKGKRGGEIKVTAVNKQPDGTVQVVFELDQPADVVPDMTAPARGAGPGPAAGAAMPPAAPVPAGGRVRVARGAGGAVVWAPVAIGPGGQVLGAGLALLDDKGNVLPATISPNWARRGVVPAGAGPGEYVATYRPQMGGPEPAKLVFTGRRQAQVSVPFKLENVELK
jgi:hypothetical protein